MSNRKFKALVVDDDSIASRVVAMALSEEGFKCTYACDGDDAIGQIGAQMFDLVVTDLRMPKKNGHTLAVELLALPSPPVIVVHSGVDDARLTKDLMMRGVDDIIYKPANYPAFAAKVAALVKRRRQASENPASYEPAEGSSSQADTSEVQPRLTTDQSGGAVAFPDQMDRAEYEQRLVNVEHLIPLSSIAYEVFVLANNADTTMAKLANTLSADAAMTADILRLANSAHYRRTNDATQDLDEACSRIGFKKIGEVALALSAIGAFRGSMLPWLDSELEQSRSLAATIALEHLTHGRERQPNDGLSLCALLHTMGRFALGSVFRDEYQLLLRICKEQHEPLIVLERKLFPECHTAALSNLLSQWNVPPGIWKPLCYIGESYEQVAALAGSMRNRVEILKLAIFIGDVAVGRWMPWDQVEPPPTDLLARHKIVDLPSAIARTREAIVHQSVGQPFPASPARAQKSHSSVQPCVAYYNVRGAYRDWMPAILASINVKTTSHNLETHGESHGVFVNCMNTPPSTVAKALLHDSFKRLRPHFLVSGPGPHQTADGGQVHQFPMSISALQATCQRFSLTQDKPGPATTVPVAARRPVVVS